MRQKTIDTVEIILGRKQHELFLSDNLLYMECLIKFDGPRTILNYAYKSLVSHRLADPIESFPIDQKKYLWETAKEFSLGRLNQEKTIELAKALYTLEYFLNEIPS